MEDDIKLDATDIDDNSDNEKTEYGFNEVECVLPAKKMYTPNLEDIIKKNNEDRNLLPLQTNTNPFSSFQNNFVGNKIDIEFYRVMSEIYGVPLSPEQKQKLKYKVAENVVKNQQKLTSKMIDYNFEVGLLRAKKSIEYFANQSVIDSNGIVVAQSNTTPQMSETETIEKFIANRFLVKERNRNSRYGYEILKRNHALNRYESVTKEDLVIDFEEYLYSSRPDIDIPQSVIDKMFKTLLYRIKSVDDLVHEGKISKISKYNVAILNGYYDLEKNIFTPKSTVEGYIFNKTSLPINFLAEDVEAEVFHKLLKSTFGDDEKIINVIYEYIGAIMSGIPIIKKIFVLQGVSNSGKSRMSRIIASCFHEDDVIYIDKLTDLKDEINFDNVMLVIIDELSDKKLNPSQVSKLKKLSNGSKQVKILATTNHPIVTESDSSVDKALYNRLAVIPFANVMDNSDPEVSAYEDVYFEMERDAIISKALKAFHKVLSRSENISNLKFSENYPLNGCVETKVFPNESEQISVTSERIQEVLREKRQTPPAEDILKKVIDELYELTDEINSDMTAESVMQTVNDVIGKNEFSDVQSFGKRLKGFFGDKLISERKNGKMCYNFQYRTVVDQ